MISLTSETPHRIERLNIKMELDKSAHDRHRLALTILQTNGALRLPSMSEGDKLNIDYHVNVEYFGHTVENLLAVTEIASDPAIVLNMSTEELNHGECLIQKAMEALAKLRETIAAR